MLYWGQSLIRIGDAKFCGHSYKFWVKIENLRVDWGQKRPVMILHVCHCCPFWNAFLICTSLFIRCSVLLLVLRSDRINRLITTLRAESCEVTIKAGRHYSFVILRFSHLRGQWYCLAPDVVNTFCWLRLDAVQYVVSRKGVHHCVFRWVVLYFRPSTKHKAWSGNK